MVNYKLNENNEGCCYSPYTDTIFLGDVINSYGKLSSSEYNNYISDMITHEFTHSVLYKMFNNIVSNLFDTVGHHFRNVKLLEKACRNTNIGVPWHISIRENGIKKFYNDYGITDNDLLEANMVCRGIIC